MKAETNQKRTGTEDMEAVITLARQIADLCVASPLQSKYSASDAMDIAKLLLDANASEGALR